VNTLRVLAIGMNSAVNDLAWKILEARGVTIERLTLSFRAGADKPRWLAKVQRYLPPAAVIRPISEAIARLKPDLVHIGLGRAAALAALRALRNYPDVPVTIERGAIGGLNLLSPIEWATYFNRRIGAVIVPSYALRDYWMARPVLAAALGRHRIEVIHHPLPLSPLTDAAQRRAIRAALGVGENCFVVGTVCAIRPIKNLAFAARVVASLDCDAILAVVGNASDTGLVRDIEKAGEGRVRILGPRPGMATMRGFDAYVTPTRAPGEGFGLATLEAMAVGLPVLATNLGGSGDLLRSREVGYALPLRESDWKTTLEQLARDPALRDRIGTAARRHVAAEFSPEAIAERTLAVWSRLAGRQP